MYKLTLITPKNNVNAEYATEAEAMADLYQKMAGFAQDGHIFAFDPETGNFFKDKGTESESILFVQKCPDYNRVIVANHITGDTDISYCDNFEDCLGTLNPMLDNASEMGMFKIVKGEGYHWDIRIDGWNEEKLTTIWLDYVEEPS